MKRIILILITLFAFSSAYSQTSVFHENFEVVDSMTGSGPQWFQQAGLYTSPTHSMRGTITAVNDSSYLTSIAFSTVGYTSVTLNFSHICKISSADAGTVEVSNNNGTTWTKLTAAQYLSSSGFNANSLFSSAVYGPTSTGWHPTVDTMTPTNTWWKAEVFNLSSLIPNVAQAKIRFKIKDGNLNGSSGNYGWLIDDINVIAAPHELTAPYIAWSPPLIQGNVYNLGPYNVTDTIYDRPVSGGCGLDTSSAATLFYSINGGATVSVHMVNISGNLFRGVIPAVVAGDSVCYYVQAADTCANQITIPATGCISFIASTGIVFPYIDNFDINTTLWTAVDSSATSLTTWEIGTPSNGQITGALSSPNCWKTDLDANYDNFTRTILTSPVFNFSTTANAKLSFWQNYNTETCCDGNHLEYTTDGTTWNILGTVGDPLGTNWYTTTIGFPSTPVWTDNTNNLWKKSTYKLSVLNNQAGPVQLRFVFTSDVSVVHEGFAIDDIAITLPSPNDVGVLSILQPGVSSPAGVVDTVKIQIVNYGSLPATNFNAHYSINGGAPVAQLYTSTIQPGDTGVLAFGTPFTVPTGSFNICAYTSMVGDGDHTNDTLCGSSQGIPILVPPYTDDFETPPSLWFDSSAAGTNWQHGTPAFGSTSSAHSPVNAWDVNLTTAYGDNAYSVLFSPLFNFSGIYNPKLSFWMNYNSEAGWDGTRLEYSLDGGNTWNVMGNVNDPNAANWYNDPQLNSSQLPAWTDTSGGWVKAKYRLGSLPGLNNCATPVQLKFVFTSDFVIVRDGASIDDIAIDLAPPLDMGVSAILQPGVLSPVGAVDTVKITITNYGATAASNFNVGYAVNAVTIATQLYPATIQPGVTDTVIFTTPFTVPVGSYSLCAFTALAGDGDTSNDTLCSTQHGIPSFTLPYYDNFDTGVAVFFDSSANSLTTWQLGTPNFGQTTGAHSAPNCWDINLNTSYNLNARCNLISPIFSFTGITNAKLSFWQNRNTGLFSDGTQLQYSTDGGTTWNQLGQLTPDPLGTYWYNNTIGFPGVPVWSGISADSVTLNPGWVKSVYKLTPLNGQPSVIFKFLFTSDAFGTLDGISIDDFKIVPPSPLDASVFQIVQPGAYSPATASDSVRVILSNEGLNPISNFDVTYAINSVVTGTGTYTGTIAPGAHATFTLPPFIVPPGAYDICAWTLLTGDGDRTNDTTCKTTFGIPLFQVPYFDDFEGANNFVTDNNEWQFGVPASSTIDSAYSPTQAWKTILAGNYSNGDNEDLYSPFFDFTNAYKAELRFYHWYLTDPNDGGRVEYSINGGATWNTLGSVGNPNGTNWYNNTSLNFTGTPGWSGNSHGYVLSKYKLNFLNNYNLNYVQFRYKFISGTFSFVNNGWAVDNFELFNPITLTASPVHITGINNPFAITGPQTISVYIKNKGSFNLNSVDATLLVDGVSVVTDSNIPFTPALVTGDSALHVFSLPWVPTLGGHDICVITSLPNGSADLDPSDDTTCTFAGEFDSVTVDNVSPPYCNDFEPGNGHPSWIPLNAYNYALFDSDWQLGTPAKTLLNSAHGGANTWITKLEGNYSPRDSSGLFSPVFAVDTLGCYELSFWHSYYTELYQDGGTVEYSIDGGVSWHVLGYAYEPEWFNSLYITGLVGGPPTSGWSGASGEWKHASHNIKFATAGHVIFRFRFGSDLTNQQEGWAIDDVCFQKIGACTIGINDPTANSLLLQNYPNPASDVVNFAYSIPEHGKVRMYITDVLGREVSLLVNESQSAGIHKTTLDVKNLADGMYYCTLEAGENKLVKKFVVAK